MKVLLVEDSPKLVERLTEALQEIPRVVLVGTVATEDEAVSFARRDAVDVIILDLHLKQGTGFGVMRALASFASRPQFVVLTNYDLPEYKCTALALGAAHFLEKARDYVKLPALLRAMQAGTLTH